MEEQLSSADKAKTEAEEASAAAVAASKDLERKRQGLEKKLVCSAGWISKKCSSSFAACVLLN